MGERYLVTGVQLGLLQVISDEGKRKKLIGEIIKKQFLGNTDNTDVVKDTKLLTVAIQGR